MVISDMYAEETYQVTFSVHSFMRDLHQVVDSVNDSSSIRYVVFNQCIGGVGLNVQ